MLETPVPTRQYTKEPFVTSDAPKLHGTWFIPQIQQHELVLVGLSGIAHQSLCYLENPIWIETLTAAGFRVLLADYRSHGASESDKALPDLDVSDYVQDVLRILKEAGLSPARTCLFGHSMGAGIALAVASGEASEAFAGVVAMAGVGGSRWRDMYLSGMPGELARHPHTFWQAMTRNPQALFLDPKTARVYLFQPSTPDLVVQRGISLTCPESKRALFGLTRQRTRPLNARRALFLAGANDGGVPPAWVFRSARDYQALGCPTEFRLLPDTPHNLMMDGRVEEAAQALVQFAERCAKNL